MNKERTLKKSLLVLAVMAVAMFAMTIVAGAANAVTGIKQTDASTSSVDIKWRSNPGETYQVVISGSKNGKYVAGGGCYTTNNGEEYIYDLDAGRSYYVKVQTLDDNEKVIATSAAFEIVTAPESVSTIKQASAKKGSITVKWSKVDGATGYTVGKDGGSTKKVTGLKASLKASTGERYDVEVTAYRKSASGFYAKGYTSTAYNIYAIPSTPTSFASSTKVSWNPKKNDEVTLGWSFPYKHYYPDGYQIQIYSVDGKKKLTTIKGISGYSSSYDVSSSKVMKAIKNKGFKARIRCYVKKDGAVMYSQWSSFKTVIPQANTTIKRKSSSSVVVTWPKVANAQKYVVYVCRKYSSYGDSNNWKKKTVSAKTRSYKITGIKSWQDAAVYVIPVVKVKGKTYKATASYVHSFYIH